MQFLLQLYWHFYHFLKKNVFYKEQQEKQLQVGHPLWLDFPSKQYSA